MLLFMPDFSSDCYLHKNLLAEKTKSEWEEWVSINKPSDPEAEEGFEAWWKALYAKGTLSQMLVSIPHQISGTDIKEHIKIYADMVGYSYYCTVTEENGADKILANVIRMVEKYKKRRMHTIFVDILKERKAEYHTTRDTITFILGNNEITVNKRNSVSICKYLYDILNR